MKKIIFDLGNVLLRFDPEDFLLKHFDQKIMEDLMIIFFCSDEWIYLDLGKMSIRDIENIFCKQNPQYKKEIQYVLDHFHYMLKPIEENIQILQSLKKQGYPLYLLSNFHQEAFEQLKKQYDFFALFDGSVISYHEHIIKPDKRIYQILLNRYHLNPQDCLFIDDCLSNIHVANELGIDGIVMNYGVSLKEELLKRNIK